MSAMLKTAVIGGMVGSALWIVVFPWLITSRLFAWYVSYAEWVHRVSQ